MVNDIFKNECHEAVSVTEGSIHKLWRIVFSTGLVTLILLISCRWIFEHLSHTPHTPRSSTSGTCTCISLFSSLVWWCSLGYNTVDHIHQCPSKSDHILCPWFPNFPSWRRIHSNLEKLSSRPGQCRSETWTWSTLWPACGDHSSSSASLHVLHQTSLST